MTKSNIEIGHNNPPPLDAHSLNIEDLFALVSGSVASEVTTDEQEAALDALMDDVRKAKKAAEDQCEADYRPHKAAGDAVKAAWKPLLARCDAGLAALKTALTPYRAAKQKAKDEAARIAREEAAAKEEAARAALRQSDDLEAKFAAEEQLKAAAKLTAQANKIDRSATGLRTSWEAEITDRKAALLFYLKTHPDEFQSLIQNLADRDARGARPAVPGIIYHERKKAA